MPDFVLYLIVGAIGAYAISIFRWLGQKHIKGFPDIPLMLGRLIDWGKPEPKKVERVMGLCLHLGTGAFWGFLFGIFVINNIFFSKFVLVEGILFSLLPWLFFSLILMPLAGGGFFGAKLGQYQWLFGFSVHIVYGLVLGILLMIFAG